MMIDGARSLAWRLGRHALDPAAGGSVAEIADRVVAFRGWPADLAELAVGVRQADHVPGALASALEAGEVIRSYAFRGGSYVFTHPVAAALLRVRGTTRVWETSRYQKQGGFAIGDWEPLRAAVLEALAAGPLTRSEIGAHLARILALRDLAPVAAEGSGADSLYKPLHWWGDICFGPTRDGQATFRVLRDDPRWPGLPDLEEAGQRAIAQYLAAYGPVTLDNLAYWLTEGLSVPRRRVLGWLTDLGDEVTEVSVGGLDAYVLSADLDAILAAEPTDAVWLLPGFDPWIMGPGTADARLIAPHRRALASRGANLVIWRGVVSGTWRVSGHDVAVSWFAEAGAAPHSGLYDEAQRLAVLQSRELALTLNVLE